MLAKIIRHDGSRWVILCWHTVVCLPVSSPPVYSSIILRFKTISLNRRERKKYCFRLQIKIYLVQYLNDLKSKQRKVSDIQFFFK